MSQVRCRTCWQPMSSLVLRCPHCGDIHRFRIRRAIAKLTVFLVATALSLIGIAWWAI
jgi:hypothetical protein